MGKCLWIFTKAASRFVAKQSRLLAIEGRRRWRLLRPTTQKAIAAAVILHFVILIIAALIVAVPGRLSAPEIVATVVETPVIPDVQRQRLSAIKQVRQASPSASASISKMMLAKTEAAVNLPTTEIDIQTNSLGTGMTNLGIGNGFGEGIGNGGGGGGGANFPMEIRGRCIAGERKRLLQKNGGSPAVEEAVEETLQWLKENQNFNGTWGEKYHGSMTGLALLCFLGRCETTTSKEYGKTVTKGIQALITLGKKNEDGYLSDLKASQFVYEHGIATYALGEALAMSRGQPVPGLREAFEEAVQKIVDGQNPDGGWCYSYSKTTSGDMSVTGWQVQALKAAKQQGISVTGLGNSIDKAASFVEGRQGPKGGFGYRSTGDKHSLTGVGILSLQFLEKSYRTRARKAFAYWFDELPEFKFDGPDCDIYASYYINQAIFNYGGPDWKKWNSQMMPEMLKAQSSDGTYGLEGKGLSEDRADVDAKIYRTALCTLMLEVYYRYLPVTGN